MFNGNKHTDFKIGINILAISYNCMKINQCDFKNMLRWIERIIKRDDPF